MAYSPLRHMPSQNKGLGSDTIFINIIRVHSFVPVVTRIVIKSHSGSTEKKLACTTGFNLDFVYVT